MSRSKGEARAIEMSRLRDNGLSWSEIGRRFDVSRGSAHKIVQRWLAKQGGDKARELPAAPAERISIQDGPGGRTIDSPSSCRIKSLEALLVAAEVDLDKWSVERQVVNKWDGFAKDNEGNVIVQDLWQVKAWLSPCTDVMEIREAVRGIIDELRRAAPKPTPVKRQKARNPHMLEFGLVDHHVGLLSWHKETGSDYDIYIAAELARHGTMTTIERARGYDIERVLMTVGNDWLHTDAEIDGRGGTTARGTAQDVDTRWPKMFQMGAQILIESILNLRELAPVTVLVKPGNHDRTRSFMLGEVLGARFWTDPEVEIINDVAPRSYYEYGVSMIGFGHADGIKEADLPLTMAVEEPEMWGRTSWREFHRAHTHGLKVVKYMPARDIGGVIVRTIPSMVAPDVWHTQKGFRHLRSSEAFLWHEDEALVGTIVVGVPDKYKGEVAL